MEWGCNNLGKDVFSLGSWNIHKDDPVTKHASPIPASSKMAFLRCRVWDVRTFLTC